MYNKTAVSSKYHAYRLQRSNNIQAKIIQKFELFYKTVYVREKEVNQNICGKRF